MTKLVDLGLVAVAALGAACGGAATPPAPGPADGARAARPGEVAPPVDDASGGDPGDAYAHAGHRVSGRLVEQPGGAYALALAFTNGEAPVLTTTLATGTGEDCEDVSFFLEPVAALGDPRLAMANLLCTRGADYVSRDIVTALVFVGDDDHPPGIVWEGTGEFTSEMDACVSSDVAFFRPGAGGTVEAVQRREVRRLAENPLPDGNTCVEELRETVRATVDVPAR